MKKNSKPDKPVKEAKPDKPVKEQKPKKEERLIISDFGPGGYGKVMP